MFTFLPCWDIHKPLHHFHCDNFGYLEASKVLKTVPSLSHNFPKIIGGKKDKTVISNYRWTILTFIILFVSIGAECHYWNIYLSYRWCKSKAPYGTSRPIGRNGVKTPVTRHPGQWPFWYALLGSVPSRILMTCGNHPRRILIQITALELTQVNCYSSKCLFSAITLFIRLWTVTCPLTQGDQWDSLTR